MNTHRVYRTYDREGVLLYIGCSSNVRRRMEEHSKTSRWYPLMARYDTTEPMPEADALLLETAWIKSLGSKFNIVDAPKRYLDGSVLLATRERLGMTRRELARLVGVMSQTLSNYERGRATTSAHCTLEKIADALGVSIEDISTPEADEAAA